MITPNPSIKVDEVEDWRGSRRDYLVERFDGRDQTVFGDSSVCVSPFEPQSCFAGTLLAPEGVVRLNQVSVAFVATIYFTQ